MADGSPGRMRAGGTVFVPCGSALAGSGIGLPSGVTGWRLAADGAGAAVLWLLATGAIAAATGVQMLLTGRRPRRLPWLFAALVAVFVVAGVVVTLLSGARMPRIQH
jgi:hypothetical protein